MFRLHFVPGSPRGATDWQVSEGRIVGRDVCFEPFRHPMVESRAVVGPSGRLGIAVFERPRTTGGEAGHHIALEHCPAGVEAQAFQRLRDRLLQWPLHWFWIDIDADGMSMEASGLPTVPVFVARIAAAAVVDWDPLGLYGYIEPLLDHEVAADYLTRFEQPYTDRTVIRQIAMLAAGHVATWRANRGWNFVPPASQMPPHARALEKSADPLHSFGELLGAALARALPDAALPLAAGLSGGLDSTAVCVAACRRGHRVDSFGLVMPGPDGVAQHARRRAVVKLLQLRDHAHFVDPDAWVFSDYGRAIADRVVPWEEVHHDLLDGLYARAAASGHDCFLGGVGGDELLLPYWDEMPDREAAIDRLGGPPQLPPFLDPRLSEGREQRFRTLMSMPRAGLQKSVMDVVAGSAAQQLRHGLWPIHLFAAPELARYCHSLPANWRNNRRLMRDWLSRLGVPRGVTHPPQTESFAEISALALHKCPIERGPLHTPLLADLGLVEPSSVAPAYRAWVAGRGPASWCAHFIAMAQLEATLRSIKKAARKSATDLPSMPPTSGLLRRLRSNESSSRRAVNDDRVH